MHDSGFFKKMTDFETILAGIIEYHLIYIYTFKIIII
jgi:hypothetical protein